MILSVANISKAFGADEILRQVTFRIEAREKVALVGRNGTGKSTILKMITGRETPDSGSVTLSRGVKIGYLRQEKPVEAGRTVLEEAQAGAAEKLELKARLEALEAKIEADSATPEDLEEYALVHEHFLDAEGYAAESDVRTVLRRMGFEESEFEKPTEALSGGEKTRLAIARLLLEEPDLLILDEPTNHLDLQAVEWLEGWIRSYHGAVLLVSHDRTFLDATAERVLDLRDLTVKAYPGPFAKFLQLKAEDDARRAEVARRQADEIAKLDEYVRRFINSQRTAQARGRQKLMQRLIEDQVKAPSNEKGIKGGFREVARSGDLVIETKGLRVGFTEPKEVALIESLDWTVRIGERWGIIGENGAGKSTLVKTILGQMEALGGKAKLGANVVVGSFSQDASDLDPESSPLDVLVFEDSMKPADARNLLGRFLIVGDDVYRPIRTLSGGEKNKLSLARLTNLNPNLLVLDEPTNHLDMASREALAEILKEFKGTLILVSHDRWLLSEVTDHTLDIRRAGPIQFGGSYAEYRLRNTSTTEAVVAASKAEASTLSPREVSKEIVRLRAEIERTENEISDQESALTRLESRLAHLQPDDDVLKLTLEHQALQQKLAATLGDWEQLNLDLEAMLALQ